MQYPLLEINLSNIEKNVVTLTEKCTRWNLSWVAVTKGFCAVYPIVKLLFQKGVRRFADSNLLNLISIRQLLGEEVELFLIRLPMFSELELLFQYRIVPFVSTTESLTKLNSLAREKNTNQRLILAVDGGDAREGFMPEELLQMATSFPNWSHLTIDGIATTVACLNGVLPDRDLLQRMVQLKHELQLILKQQLKLSVGGTTFLELWEEACCPEGVDEIRLGEAFLFGHDISRKKSIPWLEQETFSLWSEVVEVRPKKPNQSIGRGFDAFGREVDATKQSKRARKQALVAVGLQDIDDSQLWPEDSRVRITGATSNYLVLDIEESANRYQAGQLLKFKIGYGSVLRAFLSPYVRKEYLDFQEDRTR